MNVVILSKNGFFDFERFFRFLKIDWLSKLTYLGIVLALFLLCRMTIYPIVSSKIMKVCAESSKMYENHNQAEKVFHLDVSIVKNAINLLAYGGAFLIFLLAGTSLNTKSKRSTFLSLPNSVFEKHFAEILFAFIALFIIGALSKIMLTTFQDRLSSLVLEKYEGWNIIMYHGGGFESNIRYTSTALSKFSGMFYLSGFIVFCAINWFRSSYNNKPMLKFILFVLAIVSFYGLTSFFINSFFNQAPDSEYMREIMEPTEFFLVKLTYFWQNTNSTFYSVLIGISISLTVLISSYFKLKGKQS